MPTLTSRPRDAIDAPTDIIQTHVMSSSLGTFVDKDGHKIGGFGFNNVSFRAQIGYPLISQLQAGSEIDNQFVADVSFDQMGGGDLIINNLDTGIAHPYHLHGKPFFIVARGKGNLTAEQWKEMRANTARIDNPLRRDVLEIIGGSWAVLRE
jgi:FtsP/CotA-like multicopper oxidase with cupredoxin domain